MKKSCVNCKHAFKHTNEDIYSCDSYLGEEDDVWAMPVHVEPPYDEVCDFYEERKEW